MCTLCACGVVRVHGRELEREMTKVNVHGCCSCWMRGLSWSCGMHMSVLCCMLLVSCITIDYYVFHISQGIEEEERKKRGGMGVGDGWV